MRRLKHVPNGRFQRSRNGARMTAIGWLAAGRLLRDFRRNRPLPTDFIAAATRCRPVRLRHTHADEEGVLGKGIGMLQEALQQRVGNDLFVLQQLDPGEMQITDNVRINVAEGRIHV